MYSTVRLDRVPDYGEGPGFGDSAISEWAGDTEQKTLNEYAELQAGDLGGVALCLK
jgi:hypothetical protein